MGSLDYLHNRMIERNSIQSADDASGDGVTARDSEIASYDDLNSLSIFLCTFIDQLLNCFACVATAIH